MSKQRKHLRGKHIGHGQGGRVQERHKCGNVTKKQAALINNRRQTDAAAAIAENPLWLLLYTAGVILFMWAVKWLLF